MKRSLKLSFYIVIGSYAALFLILFLMIGKFDGNMVGIWGLILGFILLFAALPFHKLVYFGGRGLMGVQAPEIPGDEHLHHKIHKQYEKEQIVKNQGSSQRQDILTIAGISIILIAVFLI
ncbi:hypothetical protein [Mesobacillus selenatarsenatis]|uniref:DUF3899 domain-containing protein n=1 Tax=Mesobacillus selenatarsenatis (strain DSM 18680 / JCM 14380 / FERM P-15431 / SF-1) TaxID=1321606 RepID=A0A0A8X2L7_MESS1|nr:hypothetical protein [Mesobacillus selenatarsenatis]GAM12356.1 hypothetical protein SAMD00020551_0489 [Mesobacillus selenatarsenatis SF-1]